MLKMAISRLLSGVNGKEELATDKTLSFDVFIE
jgi:hypothetical protein